MILTPAFLLNLIIVCIIAGLLIYAARTLPLPPPWSVIVQVLAVLLAILILARLLV